MKSIREALDALLPAFEPLPAAREPLGAARGMHLASDVEARRDLPGFDHSAMDGYAVRRDEVIGATAEDPVELRVDGETRAGDRAVPTLPEGAARRIFTGAMLPPGSDAVVIQEDVEPRGELVRFRSVPSPFEHVRRRAEDVAAGSLLLPGGTRLGAGEIALLASQGILTVAVHRRPRVAIVSTGSELIDAWDPPMPGMVVDTNAYALAAQVEEAGADPWVLPRADDSLDAIVERLDACRSADVILTSGGVSVGAYDLVHEAFRRLGVETSFVKVAIKPGKPLTFGRLGRTPIVGLPGNPVSSMVTFHVFVRPGLRRMAGDPRPHPRTIPVELAESYRRRPGRTEFVRAALVPDGPRTIARLHPRQGSGSMPSMARIDALVVIPRDMGDVPAGTRLYAIPFGDPPGAEASPFDARIST